MFITFEGGEGCGKSTQLDIFASRLKAAGIEVVKVREPGGTRVGEAVRAALLDPAHTEMDPHAELLLYEASRAQLVAEVIGPALERGAIVVCDRFYDSTTAYQGYGRDLSLDQIATLNTIATRGLVPDLTIVLDIDPAVGLARATTSGADRLEAERRAFHERVRDGFLAIAAAEPDRVVVVDAQGEREVVAERIEGATRSIAGLIRAAGQDA